MNRRPTLAVAVRHFRMGSYTFPIVYGVVVPTKREGVMNRIGTALVICLVATLPVRAANPDELIKYVPTAVNTVAVINVVSIVGSPRGEKEGWAKLNTLEYLAGAIPVHPSIERIVFAKELVPSAPARGEIIAVVPLKKELDLAKFSASRGATLDDLGGNPVAILPNGTVGVKLDDTMLGLMRTDARQDVSRWMKYAKGEMKSQQSRYLNAALFNSGLRNHILLAVDTEDLFHPNQAGLAVAQSESLAMDEAAANGVEAFLKKLEGVRFLANITTNGIKAELRLDATTETKVDPFAMKAFLIELLDRNGATLADLGSATAKIEGKSVVLDFQISDQELAKVLSIVAIPVADAESVAIAPAGVTPEATKAYFRAVNTIIENLKTQNKKAIDYTKTALWHDTAASRIETLSVLNVDPNVVHYGQTTGARLRSIADSLRGVPLQAADLEENAYVAGTSARTSLWVPGRGVRINPWAYAGPQNVQSNLPQIRNQLRELVKADEKKRDMLWSQIEGSRSQTRNEVANASMYDLEAPPKK